MSTDGHDGVRVLLTGAAGFIGGHVHRALIAAGHEVLAVDAMLPMVHGPHPMPPEDVLALDIRDPDALEPLLRGIDVVCHLAAAVPLPDLPEPPAGPARGRPGRREDLGHGTGPCVRGGAAESRDSGGGEKPVQAGMQRAALYASHNDAGTAVLLAAMERAGVRRLVLSSSVAVYGEGRYRGVRSGPFFPGIRRRADLDRGLFDHREPRSGEVLTWEPLGEDAPLRPRSAYAASKVAQEHYALAWATSTGSAATALRFHHVYGDPIRDGRPLRSAESGVAARFRSDLRDGRVPRVFEDGGQVRDFVHVRDVAAAVVAAVARPLTGFVPLNIASGRPLTLWEVASIMAKTLDAPGPVVSGQYRLTDIRHLVASPDRARHALDYTARIPPARGLADYAASSVERH
ncbi:NAD-dependent epimerase/dehydratase family protein [Nocardia yamanashiensis]|uniref:NAD-dependent epimerase/dehydratase family protein n=1 Tax=Nocardia yamanashiensis TaxID=209247 RepID=UPI001E49BEE7|nr:NAD-dependent epimerase/dehydratase family protein [Nocardia yamanashiensis]UGT39624.1 NAD-dependent epimerase/dehydratase family protein [Nocardia yamanashiensis]